MNTDAIAIFLIAGVFSYISFEINRRWGGLAFQKTHGNRLQEIQKEMLAVTKSKDEDSLKKMDKLQSEFSSLLMKSTWSNMRTLLFILPLFFLFIYILSSLYPNFSINLPLNLKGLSIFERGLTVTTVYGFRGFFIVSTLAYGLILQGLYTRKIKKIKKTTPVASEPVKV